MARPRSEFLGSLGKLFSIFKKVVDKVLELGGSDEDIVRVNTDEVLATNIAYLMLASKFKDDDNAIFQGTLIAVQHPLTGELIRLGDKVSVKPVGYPQNERRHGIVTRIVPPSLMFQGDRPVYVSFVEEGYSELLGDFVDFKALEK